MKKKPWEGPGAANERAGGHLISAESVGGQQSMSGIDAQECNKKDGDNYIKKL